MKTDRQVKQDVEEELAWDPAVDSTRIGVEVEDRVVTLSGHPSSVAEKVAAEHAAHRVAGVRAVVVDMSVHLPHDERHTDEDIAKAVRAVLHWTAGLRDDAIHVQIEKGWITLSGKVDWGYQRQRALRAVSQMRGIVGVSDAIEVGGDVVAGDIGATIRKAMQRHAEREANHIDVIVQDGTVTLNGKVDSYAEREVARGAAWSAPGVRVVIDNLVVE
ncbi:BON domain-containing protein [Burkholderia ubonensis]|uniref:OsmY domain-containing protein n=1 Tax=Burkholderia ubonensis TaxID=101571 RepID=A0AAW3NA42_9BURK|nr:BON domain-containing protein [Burkholderia ubonensis]KVQ16223.1 OsmY domain-containing protein [Burkholderia ubonensis]KVT42722.1 OsmY domain-containing protein [Burkholderia ubonensis]KVU85763.1 OsmY domain-containing protein [Burkholderia ubonensis]KWB67642.1 OsmY domain-containing protein [Burkholderia ubonensis]KWB70642.1 OsmY domain-containing protein [Burkholderia ubonensis]